MLKIVSILFMLLLSGCATKNSSDKNRHFHKMFQSVNEKDAILVQNGSEKRYCVKCGMDLVKFYKTSHIATEGNVTHQYCSLHCLEDNLGDGVTLKNPKVVDVKSLKFISVTDAYYVVGSIKRGTMSKISKYAFKNLKDAKEFQKMYSGKIMNFSEAREVAKKDFKNYR